MITRIQESILSHRNERNIPEKRRATLFVLSILSKIISRIRQQEKERNCIYERTFDKITAAGIFSFSLSLFLSQYIERSVSSVYPVRNPHGSVAVTEKERAAGGQRVGKAGKRKEGPGRGKREGMMPSHPALAARYLLARLQARSVRPSVRPYLRPSVLPTRSAPTRHYTAGKVYHACARRGIQVKETSPWKRPWPPSINTRDGMSVRSVTQAKSPRGPIGHVRGEALLLYHIARDDRARFPTFTPPLPPPRRHFLPSAPSPPPPSRRTICYSSTASRFPLVSSLSLACAP